VPEKSGILEYVKLTSKVRVMRDSTLTSLPSRTSVMRDAKAWSY